MTKNYKAMNFRFSHCQLEALNHISAVYKQKKSELVREALQNWLNQQYEIRGDLLRRQK